MSGGGAGREVPFSPRSPLSGSAAGVQRRRAYLHAGQLLVSKEPCHVTTILGSCIAVCLWDPHHRIGGLTHFILPFRSGEADSTARFGNVAVEMLLAELGRLGGRALRARVYGGACLSDSLYNGGSHLGRRNTEVALEVLARHRIPVVERDTGGRQGRKLTFYTDTGEAAVQLL